jgi:hypothetical protein
LEIILSPTLVTLPLRLNFFLCKPDADNNDHCGLTGLEEARMRVCLEKALQTVLCPCLVSISVIIFTTFPQSSSSAGNSKESYSRIGFAGVLGNACQSRPHEGCIGGSGFNL